MIVSLKGDRAFRRMRRGKAAYAKEFSIRWMPADTGRVHVGIVVSRKVGKAVVRNKVRRRLRNALKSILEEQPIAAFEQRAQFKKQASFSLLIICNHQIAAADYWQLKNSLLYTMRKGGILKR